MVIVTLTLILVIGIAVSSREISKKEDEDSETKIDSSLGIEFCFFECIAAFSCAFNLQRIFINFKFFRKTYKTRY